MHNGQFATLEAVVEFYNRGGDFNAPNKDPRVRPLNYDRATKSRPRSLSKAPMTDTRVRDELPPFDRPQLYTESNRVPVIIGTGTRRFRRNHAANDSYRTADCRESKFYRCCFESFGRNSGCTCD
jgi:hypothetical protein